MLISLLCLTVILDKSGGMLVLLSPSEIMHVYNPHKRNENVPIYELLMCCNTVYGTADVFITRFYNLRTKNGFIH